MSRPLEVLTHAAIADAGAIAKQLREQGWPIDLTVNEREDGHRVVAIEMHLRVLIPIECIEARQAQSEPSL